MPELAGEKPEHREPVRRDQGHVVPIETRYYQFDQQGVAFNMWYLAYLEDARNGYLEQIGYPLATLLAQGYDIQLVHVEAGWQAPCRYGDRLSIRTRVSRAGTTSLRFEFDLRAGGVPIAEAASVYVVVAGPDRVRAGATPGKSPLPAALRDALRID